MMDFSTMTLADIELNVEGELSEPEDIMRCLRNLVLTPMGTVPLDREFGLDLNFVGLPIGTAQNLLAIELIDKVDRYEPRASVKEVELNTTTDGRITAKVVITSA